MFSIGDRAVYPPHGVGVIKGIVSVDLGMGPIDWYELLMLKDGSVIKVRVDRPDGLRGIMHVDHVESVFEVLKDRSTPIDKQTWNRRYREYTTKISTGNPVDVAAVLRDLALLKQEKALSFGERKMYEGALLLIVQELAIARDCDEKLITEELQLIFGEDKAAPPPIVTGFEDDEEEEL